MKKAHTHVDNMPLHGEDIIEAIAYTPTCSVLDRINDNKWAECHSVEQHCVFSLQTT